MSDRKAAKPVQSSSDATGSTAKPYRIDAFFKGLLPPLTADQRRELKDGIRGNGRCDPLKAAKISGNEGLPILWDGHNRDQIIDELRAEGVIVADPAVEVDNFDGRSDVALAAIRNQNARRNWTVEEKAFAIVANEASVEIAAEAKRRQLSGKRVGLHEGQGGPKKGRTDDILAEMVGCGRDYIRKRLCYKGFLSGLSRWSMRLIIEIFSIASLLAVRYS